MVLKLVWRSLKHDRSRFISAVFGVAAAVGLISWHLGLTMTAVSSGEVNAKAATAPYTAWICGAQGPGRGMRNAESESKEKTVASSEATMGRRLSFPLSGPLPASLIEAISKTSSKVALLTAFPVNIDMRPGGRVLQGPPFRAQFALLPDEGIPFDVGAIEGRLPNDASDELEVVVNEEIFGTRIPKPELGTVMPLELAAGTANLKIVGFYKMTTLVQAFPGIYGNDAAYLAVKGVSPRYPKGANLLLVNYDGDCNELGEIIDSIPEAKGCKLYSTAALAERFKSDSVKNLLSSIPMSLALAVITASSLLATVLMIGLSLQRKRIAELRCAGMTRGGVGWMVLIETANIIFIGWIV